MLSGKKLNTQATPPPYPIPPTANSKPVKVIEWPKDPSGFWTALRFFQAASMSNSVLTLVESFAWMARDVANNDPKPPSFSWTLSRYFVNLDKLVVPSFNNKALTEDQSYHKKVTPAIPAIAICQHPKFYQCRITLDVVLKWLLLYLNTSHFLHKLPLKQ